MRAESTSDQRDALNLVESPAMGEVGEVGDWAKWAIGRSGRLGEVGDWANGRKAVERTLDRPTA